MRRSLQNAILLSCQKTERLISNPNKTNSQSLFHWILPIYEILIQKTMLLIDCDDHWFWSSVYFKGKLFSWFKNWSRKIKKKSSVKTKKSVLAKKLMDSLRKLCNKKFSNIDVTLTSNNLDKIYSWKVLDDLHNSNHLPILIDTNTNCRGNCIYSSVLPSLAI